MVNSKVPRTCEAWTYYSTTTSTTATTSTALLQKLLWHLGAPDGETFMTGRAVAHGGVGVDEITIGVMLDHETVDVPPVVEDLAAEDMSADAPDRGVGLFGEPLVAEGLGVKVVHLERTVVHVFLHAVRQRRQEHGVVVHQILAAVDVREQCDFLACRCVGFRVDLVQRHVQDVARHNVEVSRVKVHGRGEVGHVESEMAQLQKGERERLVGNLVLMDGWMDGPCELL